MKEERVEMFERSAEMGECINTLINASDMMLYHYTSINALKSILRDATTEKGICFWATRFDCFADEDEYLLGVHCHPKLNT